LAKTEAVLNEKRTFTVFRALPLVGGDTFFQRGAFYAAAPWRGLQATPQAQQVVPVSGASIGRR
jgi:hypothetical protein